MKKILIGLLLDRSGSMSSLAEEVISGTNSFIEEQQNLSEDGVLYIAQFDNEFEVLSNFVPLKDYVKINKDTYVPRGMTAYYQAMCNTIDSIGKYLSSLDESLRPEKVLIITVTDGLENCSNRKYTASLLKNKITHQTDKYNWDFIFMGSSVDAINDSVKLGMNSGSTYAYEQSRISTTKAFKDLSIQTLGYRSLGTTTASDFWDKK